MLGSGKKRRGHLPSKLPLKCHKNTSQALSPLGQLKLEVFAMNGTFNYKLLIIFDDFFRFLKPLRLKSACQCKESTEIIWTQKRCKISENSFYYPSTPTSYLSLIRRKLVRIYFIYSPIIALSGGK